MKFNVTDRPTFSQPVVGNVYAISGGYGRKAGHAMILLAVTAKSSALTVSARFMSKRISYRAPVLNAGSATSTGTARVRSATSTFRISAKRRI